MVYIAVVGKTANIGRGAQHPVTFTDSDKATVIRQALTFRETQMGINKQDYEVFVGELRQKVVLPIDYELINI